MKITKRCKVTVTFYQDIEIDLDDIDTDLGINEDDIEDEIEDLTDLGLYDFLTSSLSDLPWRSLSKETVKLLESLKEAFECNDYSFEFEEE